MENEKLKELLDLIGDFWDEKDVENNEDLYNACELIYKNIYDKLKISANAWAIPKSALIEEKKDINSKKLIEEISLYKKSKYKNIANKELFRWNDKNIENIITEYVNICKKYTDFNVFYKISKNDKENLKIAIFVGYKKVLKFRISKVANSMSIYDEKIEKCDLVGNFEKIFDNF